MEIRKVGVVGWGLLGPGIGQVTAMGGFPTVAREVSQTLLERGLESIEKSLDKFVEKGAITGEQKSQTVARLKPTLRLEDLADCDLVIEAITENLPLKRELFAGLDRLVHPVARLASKTSLLFFT